MAEIAVELIGAPAAGAFWERSPHASVFTAPAVLERLCEQIDWWLARKGGEPMCLWPVCRDEDGAGCVPEFGYYVGPMWSPALSSIPAHSWLAESTRVYEALIVAVLARQASVHAQLPAGLHDVRVFDWWNYHEPGAPRFAISPRYTACIRGMQRLDAAGIEAGFRPLRRREIRRVAKAPACVRASRWTHEEVARLYCEVMMRQDAPPAPRTLASLEGVLALAEGGMGDVVAYRETGGTLVSAVVLLNAKGTANMVLNVTATAWRDSGLPAWTMHEAIRQAHARGADTFDFNGANSPNRGDDKHSYGAAPELFFELRYPG